MMHRKHRVYEFFSYSHGGRFMIKTQTKEESKFLRRILPHYYKFVMENPNTLITRFHGMHFHFAVVIF